MILTALTARFLKAVTPKPKKDITADAWAWVAEHYPESEEKTLKFRRERQAYIDGGHSAFHRREQAKLSTPEKKYF